MHEIDPKVITKGNIQLNDCFCINETSILFKKEEAKIWQSSSGHFYVSLKTDIIFLANSFTRKMLESLDSM